MTGRRIALAAVVVVATALRLWNVSSSPTTFHPTRQYAGLALAKAWYDDLSGDIPAHERAAVEANARTVPRLEPRILEAVVAASYVALGGVRVWVGGMFSSLFWAAAGVVLFLLARRLASERVAWVALVFFLFLPYGIIAGRSFQPDPAMVAFVLAAVLALVRYTEAATMRRLVAAAALAGVAVLLKPVCVFVLTGAYVAVMTGHAGARKGLASRATVVCGVGGVLPAAGYYVYGTATQDDLGTFAESGFLPRLWLDGSYWRGWVEMIDATVGLVTLAFAVVALLVGRHPPARRLLAGMLAGYVVYGLVFNYHIHTHDYYQLQLIPIAALGVGLTADAAYARVAAMTLTRATRMTLAGGCAVLTAALLVSDVRLARKGLGADARRHRAQAPVIGDLVDHSTEAVALAPAYGRPLSYEGNLSASAWPTQGDFRFRALQGQARRTTAEQLDAVTADWFIVTDFRELAAQPELEELLDRRARLVARTPGYLVYDLRSPPSG